MSHSVMASNRRLLKNSAAVTLSVAIGGILVFLAMIILARYLGVEDFGIFSTLLAIVSLIQLFADGGMVNITIRDVARDNQSLNRYIGSTSIGLIMVSALLLLITGGVVYVADIPSKVGVSLLLMLLAQLCALQGLIFGAAIRAMEDMEITAFIGVVHKLMLVAAMWGTLELGGDLTAVCAANLIVNLIQTLWLQWVVHRKYGALVYRFDRTLWKTVFKDSLPLGISMVLRKLTVHLDILLLSVLATVFAVGLYSSAYRVLQLIETASIAFSGVMLPVLSQLAVQDKTRYAGMLNNVLTFMLAAAIPLAAWLWVASDNLVLALYGEDYKSAGQVLQVLGIGLIALIPASLLHPAFAAINEQKILMKLAIASLALNSVLGVILIWYFSYLGAAIGTAVTECVVFFTGLVILGKLGYGFRNLSKVLTILLSVCLTMLVYQLLPQQAGLLPELLRLSACIPVYLMCLFTLRVYSIRDIQLMLKKPNGNEQPVVNS
ncbi:flippase [Alteromonas aestuariivivens]|uniref:Flippase n=1 Tax=Alteromonas aestuariivivens TaxID=1938339 RepID=A0A3D8MBV2_9ALTE|nr:flippase [Alteromonas aestuariivivens]RDV27506.1 flippase [Alteromonas aestuariivivens]